MYGSLPYHHLQLGYDHPLCFEPRRSRGSPARSVRSDRSELHPAFDVSLRTKQYADFFLASKRCTDVELIESYVGRNNGTIVNTPLVKGAQFDRFIQSEPVVVCDFTRWCTLR